MKDRPTWEKSVGFIKDTFLAKHSNLNPLCIVFSPIYNQSDKIFRDLLQSGYQLSVPIDTYYADWNKLSANVADHTKVMAAALRYVSQIPNLQSLNADMVAIDTEIKKNWDAGYRVVLVGHSQGNWFVNKAYEIRSLDADGATRSRNIQLPNQNKLSVVSIATPVSYVADGRKKWTSHCGDFINTVPNSLGGDVGSMTQCVISRIASTDLLQVVGGLINAGAHLSHHYLGYYLTDNSPAQEKVYQHLMDSLPDPGCGTDVTSCYLKETYAATTNVQNNWVVQNKSGYFSTDIRYSTMGYQTLYAANPPSSGVSNTTPVGALGCVTLRSRRVFTGPFTANFQLKHSGIGKSSVTLKRVSDDSVSVSFSIDNGAGKNIVSTIPSSKSGLATNYPGFREVKIVRTTTSVSLSFDGTVWTSNASDATSGYYLELDSQADSFGSGNTMDIAGLSVKRADTPPGNPSPPPLGTTTTITHILGPDNSLTLWLPSTSSYYTGGMVNDECRVGGWGDLYYCMIKANLTGLPKPAERVILRLYKYPEGGYRSQIYFDRLTSDITSGTKWWTRPSFTNITLLPQPVDGMWTEIDITDLYNAWQNGTYPNFGLQMRPFSASVNTANTFRSTLYADPAFRPRLVITSKVSGSSVPPPPPPPPSNTQPTITLSGANPLTVTIGTQFVEPGYTAIDPEDGNITAKVAITGTINTNVVGSYTRTYNVSDASGFAATTRTRTINVTAPTSPTSNTVLYPLSGNVCSYAWVTDYYYGFGQHNAELRVGGYGDWFYSLLKCTVPNAPKNAIKVVLRLRAYAGSYGGSRGQMYLDRVTSWWDNFTKWQTRPTGITITTLPAPVDNQWLEIDITDLYNDGSFSTHGIRLRPVANTNVFNTFRSPDYSDLTLQPHLVVTTATSIPNIPPPPPPSVVPLTGSCAVNGSLNHVNLQTGNTAYFGVGSSGGTGTIQYSWTGATNTNTSQSSQVYNSPGTYSVSIRLSDSASQQITVTCPQITVSSPTPVPNPTPGPVSVSQGTATPNPARTNSNIVIKVWGSNFAQGVTQLSLLSPNCALFNQCPLSVTVGSSSLIESQFSISTPGSYTLWLRNGTGNWILVPALTLRVTN
ncbi:MAG: DNRLRE domain-containing protein [Minisyncoccota bacterium]